MELPVDEFSADGILKLCEDLAKAAGCTLGELDQIFGIQVAADNNFSFRY